MHMAVEGPATTQQLNNDDQHRQFVINVNNENMQKWKNTSEKEAPKWEQIKNHQIKTETDERDGLRERFLMEDTEKRRKMMEKDGEMGRGPMIMNGAPYHPHPGMQAMMMQNGMGQQGGGIPPHNQMYRGGMTPMQNLQQMQHIPHMPPVVTPSMMTNANTPNGMETVDSNSRKRASTTPNYEDRAKRMMMENASPSNPFGYPQGTIADTKFPSHPQYQMNGGPYGMMQFNPSSAPSCQVAAQQQQQQQMQQLQLQQQQQQQQQPPPTQPGMMQMNGSFPSMIPSTSSSSIPPHPSPLTSSSSVVPPSSSTLPSSQSNGLNGSHDDLDALNTENVDVMVHAVESFSGRSFSGEDLGADLSADLGLDDWMGASTSMGGGGGPSSHPGPHSNGSNGVVLPPNNTSSAPHSNQMPTPGGVDDMGGAGPSSSSTHPSHPSPMNGYHPSPHQLHPINGLINQVNAIGAGGPDSVQSMSSLPSSLPPPPRTPTTSVMGPPSDASTPFAHMANAPSLPQHLHKSFPMASSSHTQSPLLQLSSPMGMGMGMHPQYIPTPVVPPAPAPKKRTKKAAAPKQQPASITPSPQFPMNGQMHPMYSMPHPSMINQFAPPPGSGQTPPTIEMGGPFPPNGIPPNGLPPGMTPAQYQQHYHQMMMMRQQQHQQMMMMAMQQQQQQQMRQNGMAAPPTTSSAGSAPSPQGGMMPAVVRPPMGISPGHPMMSPNPMMGMPPQQHQMWLAQQHQQRMQQQMRYPMGFPMDAQQQAQMQQMQMHHQMQQQQQMQQAQQQQLQQQQQQLQQQQQQPMQQQQQQAVPGQGSPMMGGGAPAQNGMAPQQVPSPYNPPHAQMSPAFTHTSAPFPFPSHPPMNPPPFPHTNPSQ